MSASMDLKFLESVQGCLDDFLEVECLVGDIYTSKHNTKKKKKKKKKKKQVKKHKNRTKTRLVSS